MKLGLSISLRLTFWFTGIFFFCLIVFGAMIWLDLNAYLSSGRDKTLARRAERMADLLQHARNNTPAELQKKYSDFVEATPEGRLIQAYLPNGKCVLAPQGASGFPWPQPPLLDTEFRRDIWFNRQPYRVYVRWATLNDQPVRIFVGGQLSDNQNLLARVAEILERSIPIMLLVSALAGYFISHRALMPVVRLTESARSITIGNLASRLPVSPVGDELARLAETCNDMLSRLEAAVTRIRQFTADASHELRSPIAFIRATSEYAMHIQNLDDEARHAFESIVGETEHSSRLIEDMLLLARFDAGRAPLMFEPVFLAELVDAVVSRVRVLALRKRQRLVERIRGDDLELIGDGQMLRRLIWILVDNAIKYTPPEGLIEVTLTSSGRTALLTVSDNGPGIPEPMLPRVFDRFFRVDPSRGEQDGTGLGLAIAKSIADTHHAQIVARCNSGTGTKFEVTFPLTQPAAHTPGIRENEFSS